MSGWPNSFGTIAVYTLAIGIPIYLVAFVANAAGFSVMFSLAAGAVLGGLPTAAYIYL